MHPIIRLVNRNLIIGCIFFHHIQKDLLSEISDCKIDFDTGTNIVIHSEQSELVLLQVLKILNDNSIEVEDLSAMPTNLEEIFLNMVKENASNN